MKDSVLQTTTHNSAVANLNRSKLQDTLTDWRFVGFSCAAHFLTLLLFLAPQVGQAASLDCSAQDDIPAAECSALVALYEATDGPNWIDNENWLNNQPCSWSGITCVRNSVDRIYVTDKGLTGSVPNLSALTNLRMLNLNFNNLSGALPDLSGFQKLELVDLYSNEFSESLPPFNDLPVLSYLNLGANDFTGTIPESLLNLPLLKTLVLNGNELSGSLPAGLIESGIENFAFDTADHCIPNIALIDWLEATETYYNNYEFCWSLTLRTDKTQLTTGDILSAYARLQTPLIEEPLAVDLYVSLLFPDGVNEAFLYFVDNTTQYTMATTDSSTWVPLISNTTLPVDYDSSLFPLISYKMTGTEPSGNYTWRFRATSPGSKEILHYSEASVYFNNSTPAFSIIGPDQAFADEEVSFHIQTDEPLSGATYRWNFEDGHTETGNSVSRSFSTPDRYYVTVTAIVDGQDLPITKRHYINIGRKFEDTVYALAGTQFSAMSTENREFGWTTCEEDWQVFDSKYFRLFMEDSWAESINRTGIINGLLYSDYLFERYSEIFTWDYLPSSPALDIYACDDISGAGTGVGGTFLNPNAFVSNTGSTVRAHDYAGLVHEFVHVWDFRGGAWISSKDPAHAFTGGMEPILALLLDTGTGISGWGGNATNDTAFDGQYLFRHYMRVFLNRYLSSPELDWESYFTEPFLSLGYSEMPLPEHKEHMLVSSGLIMRLFEMHGLEGLQAIFQALESRFFSEPGWSSGAGFNIRNQLTRAEEFMVTVANALQLDISDYFEYFKWPVENIALYSSAFPASPMTLDNDGDGHSPLQGDVDDSDASVYPLAPELTDGKDNNLDGLIDESVYEESASDFLSVDVQLPAFIRGEISDQDDADSFTFTLTEETVVAIVAYSVSATTTVPYREGSARDTSIFAGTVYLNGGYYVPLIHDAMSVPHALSSQRLEAGTHTISVSAITSDNRNSNPGNYELQLFAVDRDSSLDTTSLLNSLYP